MTHDESQSAATPSPPEAAAAAVAAPPNSKAVAWKSESWGQAARGVSLVFLLGMALCVFFQLSFGREWIVDFLSKNRVDMDARMLRLGVALACGGLSAVGPLALFLFRKNSERWTKSFEGWAWFLSPLILLPAIPVMLQHQAWARKHEDLLPIVLFGAIILELFVAQALRNIPEAVCNRWNAFWQESETSSESAEKNRFALVQTFLEKHLWLIVVVCAALAYGAFMSFYTVRWHNKLGTAIFDLGINNNLLYGGLEGKFNQSPVIFPDDPQMYLANHVKLGLYSFLPIYAIFPRPETLLIIQSVSLGLGAIPLFLFARKRIPASWAAALACCYLAYYPMHGANFYEMKVVPTAAAIVLACIWAIDAKRFWLGGFLFLWALIMREDVPVPLVVVGVVFLLSGHRPRAGLAMTVIASAWFIFLRFQFMNDVGSWWFPNMYEDLWAHPEKGFRSVIKTLLSNPSFTLKHIFVEKKFWYLMHLMVPIAFLPVRRWWAWAALVPGAILTLLVTDYAPPTMFSFQYVMHWSPYLFIAASLVLANMNKEAGGSPRAIAAVVAMCASTAALSFNYGAFPARDKSLESGYHKITFGFSDKEAKTLADVRALVASIPQDASVAATERVGAHLSSRVGFYTLRRGSHGVDYIVARKSGLRLDRTKETIFKALDSGDYGVVKRFGEFIVFKKGAATQENEAVIKEWNLKSTKKRRGKNRSTKKKDSPSKAKTSTPPKDDAGQKDSPKSTAPPADKTKKEHGAPEPAKKNGAN